MASYPVSYRFWKINNNSNDSSQIDFINLTLRPSQKFPVLLEEVYFGFFDFDNQLISEGSKFR